MKAEHRAVSLNMLKVSAETNCPCGGDTGHGGRTVFELEDEASTDIKVEVLDGGIRGTRGVRILLGGDTECQTFTECLFWAAAELTCQALNNAGYKPPRDVEKTTIVKHALEAAFDKSAVKGAKAADMLEALLEIYVFTRISFGATLTEILSEVSHRVREFEESRAKGMIVEYGPPLGEGDN